MKNTMKSYLLIGALFIIGLSACEKDEPVDPVTGCTNTTQTFSIEDPDLQQFKFLFGSYWVYIDSVGLTTDSVYLYAAGPGNITSNCGDIIENHTFATTSDLTMDSSFFIVVPGGIYKSNTDTVNYNTHIYAGFNANSNSNYQVTKYDSFFVYDQFYYDVTKVDIASDQTENYDSSCYYINSNYGFLRQDIFNSGNQISKRILTNKNIVR